MVRLMIAFLLALTVLTSHLYEKNIVDVCPDAKCLDGSSPAVYVHQGWNPKNILIHLTGNVSCGIWGQTLEDNLD